jgi:hypothetical protein
LTETFSAKTNFDEWETWMRNVDSIPDEDPEVQQTIISLRQSILRIHELSLNCQTLTLIGKENLEMEERLRVLSRQHSDILRRFSLNEDVLRRRLELWTSFKQDQQRLKDWIKEIENEKSILNLKHLQLDTIGDTFNVIKVT